MYIVPFIRLMKRSENFGKLKYEEYLSKQLESLEMYCDKLVRAREEVAREVGDKVLCESL